MRRRRFTSPRLGKFVRGSLLAMSFAASGCNLEAPRDQSRPAVANTCKEDLDCGTASICTTGACYSRTGSIDELLLEIVPETTSSFGGVSFVSIQDTLRRGDRKRDIALDAPSTFTTQVLANGEDLPAECGYLPTGQVSIAARLQFRRTGFFGVSLSALTENPRITVDTVPHVMNPPSVFNQQASLVKGTYDIYVQPLVTGTCQIAPRVLRSVDVDQVVAWDAPATIDLPTATKLEGRVKQLSGLSLANWQVDVVDPFDGNVISTSAKLGATTDASPFTNFSISYQPLGFYSTNTKPGSGSPLIRLRPPKEQETTIPAVYFDLEASAINGTTQVNLSVTSLPNPNQMVTVSGQVHGESDQAGVAATLQFFLQGSPLNASFGQKVSTDGAGRYSTRLLAGSYGVVLTPSDADNGANLGATNNRRWAITKRTGVDVSQDMPSLDIALSPTHAIEGVASAGVSSRTAQGATLEAAPIRPKLSVLQSISSPPVSPARGSVPVDDGNGRFTLTLDSGDFDLSLQPAAASNYAWWVWPARTFDNLDAPEPSIQMNPELLYPVPVEGTLTVNQGRTLVALSNATIHAYAPTPAGTLAKVGTARTDASGHYYLALPPNFGGQ